MTAGSAFLCKEWLGEKLQQDYEQKTKLKDFTAERIGADVAFMSNLFRVKLTWEAENSLPKKVILKIPTVAREEEHSCNLPLDQEGLENLASGDKELFGQWLSENHRNEIYAYELMSKSHVPLLLPKIYYAQEWNRAKNIDGVLAMQDLSGETQILNMTDGLELSEVLQVADQLATIHAYSLQLEDGWDGKMLQIRPTNGRFMETAVRDMKDFNRCIKYVRPDLTDLVDRVQPFFTFEVFTKAYDSHLDLGLPPVLVHGDLWPSNILWSNDSSPRLRAIIDWQTSRPGNCAEDIARLLATSVPCDRRRNETDTVLHFYHELLCRYLGREPFSYEKVKQSYEAILPYTMMFMTMGVPMWTNIDSLVEGPNKEKRITEMYNRARGIMQDFLQLGFVI